MLISVVNECLRLKSFLANFTGHISQVRRRPVFKVDLRMLLCEAGVSEHAQGRAVRVLTTCHCTDSCAQAQRSHDDRGTSLFGKQTALFSLVCLQPPCCVSESLGWLRMSAAGQTINDRILAARHSLAGQVNI